MTEHEPFVSVIIAARPGQSEVLAAEAARRFVYPAAKLEIIIARGRQPSVQRNRAVAVARGELIYFLDDDSVPSDENLIRGVKHFEDESVQIIGGPNLVPADATPLERAFGDVMGSWLAFGPSCARYRRAGTVRDSSEKELILCNMMFRKSAFTEHGGFDEALYPNEENALMDAIQQAGGRLIYDPDFAVDRRPRQSLGAFERMLMTYGRGRAEQFRLHPTLGSLPNFVPPAFLAYLLASPFLPAILLWPLALYVGAVLVQVAALQPCLVCGAPRLAPLIVLSHLAYGAGFWSGLFTRLKPKHQPSSIAVTLERIQPA
jgi:succinoglycan biosynthesis protein ExoA